MLSRKSERFANPICNQINCVDRAKLAARDDLSQRHRQNRLTLMRRRIPFVLTDASEEFGQSNSSHNEAQ